MTATQLLTWTETANTRTEFKAKTMLVAEYVMPGDDAATKFEIVKTNGSRHRLFVAGQKDGADTEGADQITRTKLRAEEALAETLSVLADVQAEADAEPQTLEPSDPVLAGDMPDAGLEEAPEVTADAEPYLGELDDAPVMDEPAEPRETVGDEIARLRAEREAQDAADAAEWEAALASRERANNGVTAEVLEAVEPTARPKAEDEPAAEPAPAAPKVQKVKAPKADKPAALPADGWTRKVKVGEATVSKCGRGKVLEVYPTSTKHWHAWVDGNAVLKAGTGEAEVFKSMKAAKAHVDGLLAAQ